MKKTQFCAACGKKWDDSTKYCLDCYHAVLKPIRKPKNKEKSKKCNCKREEIKMTDKDLKEAMKKIKVAWKKRCQLKAKGIKLRNKGDRLRNKGNKIAYKADTIFEAAVYKIKKCGVNWYDETYCVLEDGTSLKDKGAK